jgi:hypothetical protein
VESQTISRIAATMQSAQKTMTERPPRGTQELLRKSKWGQSNDREEDRRGGQLSGIE